jgi:hypothetical protein
MSRLGTRRDRASLYISLKLQEIDGINRFHRFAALIAVPNQSRDRRHAVEIALDTFFAQLLRLMKI